MKQRGRKSDATLTLVAPGSIERPKAPNWLNKRAQAIFTELAAMHEPDFFQFTTHLLAAFASACAMHEQAARIVEREGMVIIGPSGPKSHPAMAILTASVSKMTRLATKLRITNQSRYRNDSAKLRTVPTKKPWE